MAKDLHENSFDETTITKLEIFEAYAEAWIPTFVMSKPQVICIFDFFAGTGYDIDGIPGSPIRILKKIEKYKELIVGRGKKVKVYLNELKKTKFDALSDSCAEFLKARRLENVIDLHIDQQNFADCFEQLLPEIRKQPSLVYLDQNGIQFIADKYFLELGKTKQTDFLIFVSSSYFWRFGDQEAFASHVKLDIDEVKAGPYAYIHRSLIKQLKRKLSPSSKLRLYPFSLKKGANIHGIVFGASHPLAADKFLKIAWKQNSINGEANFDIDDDEMKGQVDLFDGKKLTKIESFQKRLRERILTRQVSDNIQAYEFTLQEGHITKHASVVLEELKRKMLVTYQGKSPLIRYEHVYKNKKRLEYEVLRS